MIDSRNLDDLHPALKRGVEELTRRMIAKGYKNMGVSSTYRDFEYQDYLYAQGRTRPGNIVTNCRAGQSFHNYRLAFDIFKNIKGQEYSDLEFFKTAGKIWVEMGGVWGGNFVSFVDRPHFEYTGGLKIKDMQEGKRLPDNAKMPWESQVPEYKATESEETEMRYNTIAEMPDWAKPTIQKLVNAGILKGNDGNGTKLDLSLDMIRIFVTNDMAGIYDGRAKA